MSIFQNPLRATVLKVDGGAYFSQTLHNLTNNSQSHKHFTNLSGRVKSQDKDMSLQNDEMVENKLISPSFLNRIMISNYNS